MRTHFTLIALICAFGSAQAAPSSQPASQPTPGGARPADAVIAARVADAEARLSASAAGQTLWAAIEAHGGLDTWFNNGPIHFRFDCRPIGDGDTHRDSHQWVDTWSARAVHTLPDEEHACGWAALHRQRPGLLPQRGPYTREVHGL